MPVRIDECLVVGSLEVNCYLVADVDTGAAVCIDPGGDGHRIIAAIRARDLDLAAVLITHSHADHIMAAPEVADAFGVPVLAPDGEQDLWSQAADFMAFFGFPGEQPRDPDRWIRAGESLDVGGLRFETLDVRGHSPAALAFLNGDLVFVGDALFAGSVGRTDMPGQDHATLIDRICRNILSLPPNTRVYPGHGPETTVAHEAENNPFLRDCRGAARA